MFYSYVMFLSVTRFTFKWFLYSQADIGETVDIWHLSFGPEQFWKYVQHVQLHWSESLRQWLNPCFL